MKLYLLILSIICVNNTLAQWINNKGNTITDDANWMKYINENLYLHQINIPGTHDSGTAKLTIDMSLLGATRTQKLSIMKQLESGVRFLDIRLGDLSRGHINIVHGKGAAGSTCLDDDGSALTLQKVLNICNNFLYYHSSETIIISLKHETDGDSNRVAKVKEQLNKCKQNNKCYISRTIPKLTNVRRKIVIATRETVYDGIYLNFKNGAYDKSFSVSDCGSYKCRIQDSYNLFPFRQCEYKGAFGMATNCSWDIKDKWNAINSLLNEQEKQSSNNYIAINCMNISGIDTDKKIVSENLDFMADLVNEQFSKRKLILGKQYGWIVADYINFYNIARKIYQSNNITRCGPSNGNLKCLNNQCCSQYGYCGETGEYCGVGCKSGYGRCGYTKPLGKTTTNGMCGHLNGLNCHTNYCCSKYGYCGTSNDHCKSGCQSSFGKCK